ncbi:MAG TPA: hypothetical protein VE967_07650, partial [Gemmatimonadaceae bacterium]|nr:hypothetical protein [Gemmatimonadaceae bacterium]
TPNPTLRVTVTTTGSHRPSGYTVGVDSDYYYGPLYTFAAPANGVASMRLPPGSHTVFLIGVPSNCNVSPNLQAATLTLGATTDVAFAIVCQ